MADIFISYSSKDKAKADQLSELLASAGLSVWIDRSGIEVATSWSKEIVQAIDACKAFVVLLSPNSIISKNVVREVSLAFEKNKKILPLDLEPVQLSEDLQYHLAGIQRAPMTNIDAIIRAIGKLGLEATQAPQLKIVKEMDSRKTLMILPFEDLSPTADNAWFADGIVSEMISSLSQVKALHVTDAQATKDFKRYQGTLPNYARELNIRYFIQGDVRKFGDNIKITTRLLDIETGDHLWQDSLKGTMDDIFDIQEKVAGKVVEGLKVHLASDEMKMLVDRGTENADAYELLLKGREYYARNTMEGYQLADQLYSEAIKLDPRFAQALSAKAGALAALNHYYDRDDSLLEEGLQLVTDALRLKPNLWKAYGALSSILTLQGKLEESEQTAKEYIRILPDDYSSHFALAIFYMHTKQFGKAIPPFEESLRINPLHLTGLFNLVICCQGAKEDGKVKHWSEVAIPLYEKHLRLFPDDEWIRVNHAVILHFAGRDDESKEAARGLSNIRDGLALFNTACLQCDLEDFEAAIKTVRKAMEAGFRAISNMKGFLNEYQGIGRLKGTPEWEEVNEMVNRLEADEAAKKNG